MKIGDRAISLDTKPYLIAEACINHQGDVKLAEAMVVKAKASGADAIKFQLHVLDDEMLREAPQSANFQKDLYSTLSETNLTIDEHILLRDLCRAVNIDYLCTPFSIKSLKLLDEFLDPLALKFGSGELLNKPLFEEAAGTHRPMIVSTGMASVPEIDKTYNMLRGLQAEFMLLHCVSAYPAPAQAWNLGSIPMMRDRYLVEIGFSDHSVGVAAPIAAVALGASVIEKHVTLDRSWSGPDHLSSATFDELALIAASIDSVWRGRGVRESVLEVEEEIRAWAHGAVVTLTEIAPGEELSRLNCAIKRPSAGDGEIPDASFEDVLGRTASHYLPPNVRIKWTNLV